MRRSLPIFGLVLIFTILLHAGCSDTPPDKVTAPGPLSASDDQLPIPPPPQEYNARVVVYGDTHAGAAGSFAIHNALMTKFVAFHASHIFHVGDLVETGTDPAHWQEFDNVVSRLDRYPAIEYYPALGEHDDPAMYFAQFPDLPTNGNQPTAEYYFVEDEQALFVVLNVSQPGTTAPGGFDTQKAWLEQVLSNHANDDVFRFVFFHTPAVEANGGRARAVYAGQLHTIFERYHVDAVFTGHTHAYQRWSIKGIPYVVTGGGGGALDVIAPFTGICQPEVTIEGTHHYVQMFLDGSNDVTVEVKDLSGNVIDSFPISKTTPPPAPLPPLPVSERIIVNGDTHAGQTVHGSKADSVHASFIPRYLAFSPTQVFNTGDQVENGGSNAHWDLFDGHIAPLEATGIPYYPTIGNHDNFNVNLYLARFPDLPENGDGRKYYYVETDIALYIVLRIDSESSATDFAAQAAWVEQVLCDHKFDDVYRFVFFHVPGHAQDMVERGTSSQAASLDGMFEEYGVDAVFSGHHHAYQRFDINGIHYVVTGGAGGVLHHFDIILDPDGPFFRAYNYVEIVFDEESADATVWATSAETPESGPLEVRDTFTITKE